MYPKPVKNFKIHADILKNMISVMTTSKQEKFKMILIKFRKMLKSGVIDDETYENIHPAMNQAVKEVLKDNWIPDIGETWNYTHSHVLTIVRDSMIGESTGLMVAVKYGFIDIIKLLVNYSIDTDID